MSSLESNLSEYDANSVPNGGNMSIGIVVSEWNNDITFALRDGCIETLKENGVEHDQIHTINVPGTYELPVGARLLFGKEKLDAIICIGCVIKGETMHDEYINNAVAQGIMNLGLSSGKPVIFGVLTPNDKQQALDRAGGKYGNKGVEAAITAMKMIELANKCKMTNQGIGFQ